MELQAQVLVKNLAASGAGYLLVRDYTSVETMLIQAMQFPGVHSIQLADNQGRLIGDVVRDAGGEVIAQYGNPRLALPTSHTGSSIIGKNQLVVWQPLILGELIGWVKLSFSLREIDTAAARIWTANLITAGIFGLLAVIMVMLLLRRPTKTIQNYTEFADQLNDCSGKQVHLDRSSEELSRLGHALNRASSRLCDQSNEISKAIQDLERLAAFTENSPSLALSMHANGKVEYANPSCKKLLSELGIKESDIKQLLPINTVDIAEKVISEEKTIHEIEHEFANCKLVWTFSPVKGQPLLHICGADITEKIQAEKKIQEAFIAKFGAEAANKAKSQFLASMSHELRTPLNAIIGYSEILSEEAEERGQGDFIDDLHKIRYSGKHLLSLINEILDLSKIEAGKMELYLEDFSISALIHEVSSTAKPLAEKNNNLVNVSCEKTLGHMHADSTKLRQILLNLLSNACKFTKSGTISLEAESANLNGDAALVLKVRDSGIGMTQEQIDRVFEPFTQAEKGTSYKYGGTGLGLSISKRFVEMMGGDITANSTIGQGTEFVVVLPLTVDSDAAKNYYQSRTANPVSNRILGNSADRRKSLRTVLIIDDDVNALDLAERYLRKEGFLVKTATSGEEGLRLAEEAKPDVIMLDVMMPVMDGWAVLRSLKGNPRLHRIPVAMVSMADEQSIAANLGADDYVLKPLNGKQLSDLVKKWVRNRLKNEVLFVSSDKKSCALVASQLEAQGYRFVIASDKYTAMEVCDQEQPAIVIVDLMLEGYSGFEFVKVLRDKYKQTEVPVIALASEPISDLQIKELERMPHTMICKNDFASSDLVEKIFQAIDEQAQQLSIQDIERVVGSGK